MVIAPTARHRPARRAAAAAAATGVVALAAALLAPAPPSAASPAELRYACPAEQVDGPGFVDATPAHAEAIACLAWLEVTVGVDEQRYGSAEPVTRGQMAAFLARLLERLDVDVVLPPPTDGFADVAGTTHEHPVNRLAAAGVVNGVGGARYEPDRPVRRDQMASLLVGAAHWLTGEHLTGDPTVHRADDVDPHSVHAQAIAGLLQRGVVLGTADGRYEPHEPVRRDQMASFLVRTVDVLIADGLVPPHPAVLGEITYPDQPPDTALGEAINGGVEVRLTDHQGLPVEAGREVSLRLLSEGGAAMSSLDGMLVGDTTAVTDRHGVASFDAPVLHVVLDHGTYRLGATDELTGTRVASEPFAARRDVVVLRGKVLRPDGEPAAGASVAAINLHRGTASDTGHADADGAWELQVLPGEYEVRTTTGEAAASSDEIWGAAGRVIDVGPLHLEPHEPDA